MATQIAKLRFFISLAIDQQPTDDPADNYGIKPLPNLETRFVAADALLGLGGLNRELTSEHTRELQQQLNANRERHFHANTRALKRQYRERDKELRRELAVSLTGSGLDAGHAVRVADWDPYDQNASADWFDPEYMFGVASGFDVVIGNPPYVQLQRDGGRLGNMYKGTGYTAFTGTGDIYYLFYEKAVNLLKQDAGNACLISSNQWMRVDSGKVLRRFIESQNPLRLVNLGAAVFDTVTVNTSVLLVNRSSNKGVLQGADVKDSAQQFPPTEWTVLRPLNGETWAVLPASHQSLKAKLETVGTPLKDWDLSIFRGVVTGFNSAFVIDNATKDTLIADDPKSAEIIKPILRGRDVQRYQGQWAGLWLVYVPWHFPLHSDSSIKGVSSQAEDLFKKRYPAIYKHLLSHRLGLSARNKSETGVRYEWYALQRWGANYHAEFAKEKIAWGNLNNQAKFAYVPEGTFINAPTTMLTPYSPYLLAVLNSTLLDWYFRQIGVERDGGYYEYKPMFIERLPIPKITAGKQRPFIRLVDRILKAKDADAKADTSALEAEIDRLVYALYGLTEEEIAAVEG